MVCVFENTEVEGEDEDEEEEDEEAGLAGVCPSFGPLVVVITLTGLNLGSQAAATGLAGLGARFAGEGELPGEPHASEVSSP